MLIGSGGFECERRQRNRLYRRVGSGGMYTDEKVGKGLWGKGKMGAKLEWLGAALETLLGQKGRGARVDLEWVECLVLCGTGRGERQRIGMGCCCVIEHIGFGGCGFWMRRRLSWRPSSFNEAMS
jgi:hypothetical protein